MTRVPASGLCCHSGSDIKFARFHDLYVFLEAHLPAKPSGLLTDTPRNTPSSPTQLSPSPAPRSCHQGPSLQESPVRPVLSDGFSVLAKPPCPPGPSRGPCRHTRDDAGNNLLETWTGASDIKPAAPVGVVTGAGSTNSERARSLDGVGCGLDGPFQQARASALRSWERHTALGRPARSSTWKGVKWRKRRGDHPGHIPSWGLPVHGAWDLGLAVGLQGGRPPPPLPLGPA